MEKKLIGKEGGSQEIKEHCSKCSQHAVSASESDDDKVQVVEEIGDSSEADKGSLSVRKNRYRPVTAKAYL